MLFAVRLFMIFESLTKSISMKRSAAFIPSSNCKLVLISQEENGNQGGSNEGQPRAQGFSRERTLGTRLQ